jgi:hypothetical protein
MVTLPDNYQVLTRYPFLIAIYDYPVMGNIQLRPSASEPVMVNGAPVEDAFEQLQLQLQMVQSCLRSDAASVAGHVFYSYKDNYQWVVANCSPEDWQYGMDMPALYSLVCPDGQKYDVVLTEESNSSRAGYASSAQARLSLSFKTKVPGICKWESTEIKMGFGIR